jgi:WD40 repeat protein
MRLPSTRTIGVAGSDDGLVRVWDLESRDLLYEPLKSHDGKVNAVAVGNLRGRLIAASGGNDRTVRVWDRRWDDRSALRWKGTVARCEQWLSGAARAPYRGLRQQRQHRAGVGR